MDSIKPVMIPAFSLLILCSCKSSLPTKAITKLPSMYHGPNASARTTVPVKPGESVVVQTPDNTFLFSEPKLVETALRYAKDRMLSFDFARTESAIWVRVKEPISADVWFTSGLGQPALNVAIDKYGSVISHQIWTLACGTDVR